MHDIRMTCFKLRSPTSRLYSISRVQKTTRQCHVSKAGFPTSLSILVNSKILKPLIICSQIYSNTDHTATLKSPSSVFINYIKNKEKSRTIKLFITFCHNYEMTKYDWWRKIVDICVNNSQSLTVCKLEEL